ncbi:orotidine-5'-phosphate decarboxylase [Candidatus Chloroploca sp. M-50]|uniref:Orotidine 5'-phosphate decarboxylase n=1 Tax=Candidatus Chloroploca mongolica TaxID=2528176 RepID=A0ABS4D5R3_9CHLR|nr:orotidine-5'-phosphate decarboxylase [Candidatus Chloroploca mongolica]MBP1464775.1 orotidine-5'-phosphate decarboxylase [Candidatus Chloroploca mongolica]
MSARSIEQPILVALDVATIETALNLVGLLQPYVGGFKVGLELCTALGTPQVVEAVGKAGGALFLDLKLHDIPNTVAASVRAVCELGSAVRMLTLHCQGGAAMLRAAVAAAHAAPQRPLLLGVTVLTSIDGEALHNELGVGADLETHVVHLARLAQACGLDGVVASPHEVAAIRAACGPELLIVTPGVRPTWAARDDQRRVMTPTEAIAAGADYLVVGRPITAADDPVAAAARIVTELAR